MEIIAHRCNTSSILSSTNEDYGVEIDIRSHGNDLILQHDPFCIGEKFENWLKCFKHRTLVLNIKEEGLEDRILDLLKKYQIEDYFFLDQSFPFLVKYANKGMSKAAVRVSEYEDIGTAILLARKVLWVWIDFFSRFPLNINDIAALQNHLFKICIVSPELQGHNPEVQIPLLARMFSKHQIKIDAVCTKRPDLWELYVEK